jgi:predicted TIM-barrel fold metal-dependent hydrolase
MFAEGVIVACKVVGAVACDVLGSRVVWGSDWGVVGDAVRWDLRALIAHGSNGHH